MQKGKQLSLIYRWPLMSFTFLGEVWPESDGNEGLLHILPTPRLEPQHQMQFNVVPGIQIQLIYLKPYYCVQMIFLRSKYLIDWHAVKMNQCITRQCSQQSIFLMIDILWNSHAVEWTLLLTPGIIYRSLICYQLTTKQTVSKLVQNTIRICK